MKSPRDKIREYEADGIQEYDNPMPNWWLGLFYFTIIFSIAYMVAIHYFEVTSLEAEMQQAMEAKKQLQSASSDKKSLAELVLDSDFLNKGKEVYMTNCIACHGSMGEGGIGPNLTDEYWLHGGSDEDIVRTISQGVADKGMPPWEPVLGINKIQQVAAYIVSLQGSNPPNAKEPQGNIYKRK